MRRIILVFLCQGICAVMFAQAVKDTIYFNNGSMVIGELKKVQLGVLTFDPDDANDITVQLRKIKMIQARTKIYRIETIQDKVIFGILAKDSINHVIDVIQFNDTVTISVEDISNLYPFDKSVLQRFSGNLGVGYSYTKSSQFGRLDFDGSLNYISKQEEIKLKFSGIYTITDSSFSRDREDINLKYNYYFSPTSFATAILAYQRNVELGLNRRYQEGVGVGNKFITTKNIYAWARGGLVINQELSVENVKSGNLTEFFSQLQFNLFRFTKPEINIDFSETVFFGITEKGRIRNDGELDINWEMIDDLNLSLGFYTNFDNQPPGKGSITFDYGLVFGVNYKF